MVFRFHICLQTHDRIYIQLHFTHTINLTVLSLKALLNHSFFMVSRYSKLIVILHVIKSALF